MIRRLLLTLTGGRPMRYSEEWFFDYMHWNPVDLYEDQFGRRWLATSAWDLRRERLRGNDGRGR